MLEWLQIPNLGVGLAILFLVIRHESRLTRLETLCDEYLPGSKRRKKENVSRDGS